MSTQLRIDLLTAAELYLEYKPKHKFGFCWWAVNFLDPICKDAAYRNSLYRLVDQIRQEMAYMRTPFYKPMPAYVSGFDGYNAVRAQFVADLRAHLLADL